MEEDGLSPDAGVRAETVPSLGPRTDWAQEIPTHFPTQGPLTGGLAAETLSCLHFEACPVKCSLAPRRPADQGGLGRSTRRD